MATDTMLGVTARHIDELPTGGRPGEADEAPEWTQWR